MLSDVVPLRDFWTTMPERVGRPKSDESQGGLWARVENWTAVVRRGMGLLAPAFAAFIGAASLAYSTEQIVLTGWRGAIDSWLLIVVGITAAGVLSYLLSADLRAARRRGVVVHFAILRKEEWRKRHEIEHEMLLRWLADETSYAVVTAPIVCLTDPEKPGWSSDLHGVADQIVEAATVGRQLIPGGTSLTLLASGDSPSVAEVANLVSREFPGWDLHCLSDRKDSRESPFVTFDVLPAESGGSRDPAFSDSSAPVVPTFLLLGGQPVDSAWKYATKSADPAGGEIVVTRNRLKERPHDYEDVLDEVRGALPPHGQVELAVAGPASMSAAVGWLVGCVPNLQLKTLRHSRGREGEEYVTTSDITRPGSDEKAKGGVSPVPRVKSHVSSLYWAGVLSALPLTWGIGNVATALEWGLANANPSATWRQWAALSALVILPILLGLAAQQWYIRLRNPRIIVQPGSGSTSPTVSGGVLTPQRELNDPAATVRWIQGVLANVHSVYPESSVTLDMRGLDEDQGKAIGSYLARGHRGTELLVRVDGQERSVWDLPAERPGSSLEPEHGSPHLMESIAEGYRNAYVYENLWLSPNAGKGRS